MNQNVDQMINGVAMKELPARPPVVETKNRKSSFQITRVVKRSASSADDLDDTTFSEDLIDLSEEIDEPDSPQVENGILMQPPSPACRLLVLTGPNHSQSDLSASCRRFKIVTVSNAAITKSFSRGRWTCCDYCDPPLRETLENVSKSDSSARGVTAILPGTSVKEGASAQQTKLLLDHLPVSSTTDSVSRSWKPSQPASVSLLSPSKRSGDVETDQSRPCTIQFVTSTLHDSEVPTGWSRDGHSSDGSSLDLSVTTAASQHDTSVPRIPESAFPNTVWTGHYDGTPTRLSMTSALSSSGVESNSGTASPVNMLAIDNKIEQAMDLVKSHLMQTVHEEVDNLKSEIRKLVEEHVKLEKENMLLRACADPKTLALINLKTTTQQTTVIGTV